MDEWKKTKDEQQGKHENNKTTPDLVARLTMLPLEKQLMLRDFLLRLREQ